MMTTRPQKTAKFAILSHGHAGFPNRVKRSEGSDTTPASLVQKVLRTERKNSSITKLQTDHAAQRGRDAFGAATRISASLLRRLSAFFRSVSDQDPKAAKLAVLIPGPGMLVNVRNAPRVVIPPPSETPRVSVCKPLCAILLAKASSVPTFIRKSECGPFCRRLRQELFCRVVPIDGSRGWVFVTAFERPLKSV